MNETELLAEINSFIEQQTNSILEDIRRMVAVRSVEGTPAPGAPYGEGVRAAMDLALDMARHMGLSTGEDQGHMVWAEVPGNGANQGYLSTITHLDIVPEGEGWHGDPLTLRQNGDWLLGRGVADDKGPSILCLYMAKFFQDKHIPLRYNLRVLLGGNEETGMQDVEHYLAHHPQPLFCFSPDAEFPVCNGEKGVFSGNFISPPLAGNIVAFGGGIASNVVPDKAFCLLKTNPALLPNTEDVTVSAQDGMARLDAKGIGGHAARPEGTRNAIGLLVHYLLENRLCQPKETEFLQLLQKLFLATDGSGLGIACRDDVFDPLTCIGGTISFAQGVLRQNINIRFPTATSSAALRENLSLFAARYHANFRGERGEEPFYIPANSPSIQTLLHTYNQITGSAAQPFTMGGGTYARHFAHAVSYGPEEIDEILPDFAGPVHGANEGIRLSALLKALKIYILAIWRLQAIDY